MSTPAKNGKERGISSGTRSYLNFIRDQGTSADFTVQFML